MQQINHVCLYVPVKSAQFSEMAFVYITETSHCAIGNFRKWLLYKCFMNLSLIVIQTNILNF